MNIAMKKSLCLGTLLLGATVIPASAQMAPMSPPMGGSMGAPMTAPMMGTPLPAMDRVFMTRAAEGNMAEVALGQLALRKSKNQSVRMVAQTIIKGHTDAQIQLVALATRKGVKLPMMLSPTHMAVQTALNKAKGDAFDKMYMANQTDDHENTIALFANEMAMGEEPDAKALAGAQLPDIVGHTIMIYAVARQVMAPGSELRPAMPPTPPGIVPTMMPMPGMPMAGMPMTPGMTPMPMTPAPAM